MRGWRARTEPQHVLGGQGRKAAVERLRQFCPGSQNGSGSCLDVGGA